MMINSGKVQSYSALLIEKLQQENEQLQTKLAESEARVAELSNLCRFMCKTWDVIDKFVYENCDGDALMKYPVIQGTQNQFDLRDIGSQPFNRNKSRDGAKYLLANNKTMGNDGDE
jgi:hypothetical protein